MTSKLNIFNSLPQHASDSEDEVTAKNAKTRSTHEKRDQRKQEGAKGPHGHAAPRDPTQKEDVTRSKNQQKQKGVTAEPHPQDRQSGTGSQAYGGKPKKGGAGKGNWGNYKEDRKPEEGAEEVESPEVVEEEKPEGLTLQEYLANKRVATSQPQVNEAKSKITSEQLMKEVGKATLLKNKVQQEIDDKKVGTKKGRLDVDHHASINTEHSELLNFRTGFVEREYKERTAGDRDQPQQPRKFGGKREHKEEEAKPEATAETTTTEAPAGGAATTEAKPQEEGQKRPAHKGTRGGYNKGGDRPQGERRPYQNKPKTTNVNVEDESAFPKLG